MDVRLKIDNGHAFNWLQGELNWYKIKKNNKFLKCRVSRSKKTTLFTFKIQLKWFMFEQSCFYLIRTWYRECIWLKIQLNLISIRMKLKCIRIKCVSTIHMHASIMAKWLWLDTYYRVLCSPVYASLLQTDQNWFAAQIVWSQQLKCIHKMNTVIRLGGVIHSNLVSLLFFFTFWIMRSCEK